MFGKQTCQAISFGLVGCMLTVAWSAVATTLVPNSTVVFSGAAAHENTIMKAVYLQPPHPTPLPLDGVSYLHANNLAHRGSEVVWHPQIRVDPASVKWSRPAMGQASMGTAE